MIPKKIRSSYIFFLSKERIRLKVQHPTYKAVQITKLAAENWNKLSKNEKVPYETLSQNDRKRYEKEFQEYRNSDKFDISSLPLKELKQMCKAQKLKVTGKKAILIQRLKSKGPSKNTKSKSKEASKNTKSKSKEASKNTKSKSKEASKNTKSKSKEMSKNTKSKSKGPSKNTKSKDVPTTVKEQIDGILES